MDWKRLDSARQSSGPIEVDLIEAYAQGRINRRNFVKRGTIIGLSVPFMGAIIAACGDDDDSSGDTAASGTEAPAGSDAPAGSESAATSGGIVVVANQQGDADSGLDPINTLDLGTYNVLSQSLEYLVGATEDGNIAANALASEWSPNEDGSVWTFKLRENAVWSDGSPVTSADVAATMDRLAEANNAGLGGVIDVGSTDSSDPTTAVITLISPNGNFPVLVSMFNAQSLITPVDYTTGTTLNERPEGSGAFMLDSWDPATLTAKFVRNDQWWGGPALLDGVEIRGFADIGTMVTAMQSREVDAIQQFSVLGGEGLLSDDGLNVIETPASTHRQIWFNTSLDGTFQDKLARQAVAWALDREQMVSTLFDGRATVANDHPVISSLAFFDPDAVEQRSFDPEQAKQLLAEAGVESLSVTLDSIEVQEVPDLARLVQQNLAEAGIEVSVNLVGSDQFYGVGTPWACPDPDNATDTVPCPTSSEFGIVDWGHRPTPDVYFTSALGSGGVWNASNYANPDFDAKVKEYQAAADVDSQKAAVGEIQKILWDDVPAVYPYFYNFLAASDASVEGMWITALGHTILSSATKG